MKKLSEITEEEAKEICRLAGEPYLSVMAGKWPDMDLEIQIETTTTLDHASRHDSCIWIYKNGTVRLWRNTGDWNGSGDEEINALPITDYLRKQGYEFDYSKPEENE